ncbi:hypothetical protein [Streptomyces sp. NRRL B-24085]|uniref:hypothetical protein n=1 Tax=Streptomyces sp. NRRL B-24085 TaxID=1709476 RepID=UPI000AD4F780|nr:hypothetical protein [Streptomyces sp. NRRL B-24085]
MARLHACYDWAVAGLARSPLVEAAFERLAVPADPDTLILHHGGLRAMVQGSYGG